jgi:LmbE family N-acetylglucosaminyl deacetylase
MDDIATILVVVAHPDDTEAYCGGTIAKLARSDNRVVLVICTDGDGGSHDTHLCPTKLASIRRGEQRRAMELVLAEYCHPSGKSNLRRRSMVES